MQDFVPYSARSPEEPAPPSGPSSLPPDSPVKSERHSSSPSSPSSHPFPPFIHTPSLSSGPIPTHTTRKKRSTFPYNYPPPRASSGRRQHSSVMSAHYGNWPSNAVKHEQSGYPPEDLAHRSSDGDQPPYYFTPDNTMRRYRSDIRPNSSGSVHSSSLTGAVGGPAVSGHSSPSSDRSFRDPSQSSHVQSTPMDWVSDVHQPDDLVVAGGIFASFYASPTTPSTHSSANPNLHFTSYSSYNRPEIYELSGPFTSSTPYSDPGPPTSTSPSMSLPLAGPHSAPVHSSPRKGAVEEELKLLRSRVRELEVEKEIANRRIRELQVALPVGYPRIGIQPSGLPVPNPPAADAFQESWNARTDARTRTFCSLNRAGNALCAWHDSRRERRAYPPRMAPPGHLNCGCTFEEALFEESLARHGIGSYHPGENVRMDPALRNPLLQLLKQRYGYKDGDFERDPVTGTWVEGEGPALWETRALSGNSKKRLDDKRS